MLGVAFSVMKLTCASKVVIQKNEGLCAKKVMDYR